MCQKAAPLLWVRVGVTSALERRLGQTRSALGFREGLDVSAIRKRESDPLGPFLPLHSDSDSQRNLAEEELTSMLEQRSRHLAPILLVLSAWFSGLACNSNAPQSAAVGKTASAENQTGVRRGAVVRWAEGPSLSAPLGLMANSVLDVGEGEPGAPLRRPIGGNTFPNFVEKNPDYGSQHLSPNMPPILVRFAGLGFGFPGFSPSGTPPDTNGDVGPNHYVHIVNSSFVVLDRTDGHVLAGPMPIRLPFANFTGAGGACATT